MTVGLWRCASGSFTCIIILHPCCTVQAHKTHLGAAPRRDKTINLEMRWQHYRLNPIKDGSDLVIQKAASDILQCATSQDGTGADMPGTCHPCSNRSRSVARCPATAWYPDVYHALGHLISDISPNDVLSLASSEKKFDSTDETEKTFRLPLSPLN